MSVGKNLLTLFLCINIMAVVLSYFCINGGAVCAQSYSPGIITYLFQFSPTQDLSQTGGPELTSAFADASASTVAPQSSGFNIFEGLGLLLDGLKMILGLITLLTPFPVLDFLYSMGMPIIFVVLVALPTFLIWIISIAEFVRGGQW